MNKLPLVDGQIIHTRRGIEEVMGEIKPPHSEPICWTLQGNWYRRRDGQEMTGAYASDSEGAITLLEWGKRRKQEKNSK